MRSIKILWALLIFGIHPILAATTSGVLKGDETWEGVVIVTGDVIVPEGVTLRIRPNALIRFNASKDDQQGGYDINKCELIIEGVLRAEGQDKYEIRFTSVNFNLPGQETKSAAQPQAGDWYGIVFKKGDHDKSILTYSVVEFAYDGITCINASPRLFRNRIEGNYWNGILCDIMSAPKINSNQILNNGYAGLNCKIGSSPVISGNEITGNRYGVLVQDVSQPVIGDVRLGENAGKNAIYANLEFNLYNHTKNVIYAQRNDWGDNTNADKTIHDDDENKKFGLVVYTPVYRTGRISYSEFQSLASEVPAESIPSEEDKKAKEKELEDLKKKLAEKKEKATKEIASGMDITSKEEKEKLAEEQAKENERLKLLEEQIKQQEQIKIEQAKALAEQKKNEEIEKQKAAAAAVKTPAAVETKTTAASSFIPTKMANELDNNPKPIQKVKPIMPDFAKNAKVSGTVLLRVLVGVEGTPEEIYVSKKIGNKDFDQMINDAAIEAVKKWVFEKGISGGQPVKYWTVVSVIMQ